MQQVRASTFGLSPATLRVAEMANAIMVAIGKAKPKGMRDEPSERDLEHRMVDEEDEAEDIDVDEGEMAAAKAAYDAKSAEEYAKALKAFVQLCYTKHEEEEKEGY